MAITAGVLAAGALASGIGSMVAARNAKKAVKGSTYGQTKENQQALKDQYSTGIAQGNANYTVGDGTLNAAASRANDLATQGNAIAQSANGINPAQYGTAGSAMLNAYQPGQVAAAQQQVALDQGALNNLGAARSGGALGLRNALVANAGANAGAAGNAALMASQEQQALLGMRVGQQNLEQGAQFDQNALAQQQKLQLMGLGTGLAAQGTSALAGIGSNIGQLGLANQNAYLDQQQNLYNQQSAADMGKVAGQNAQNAQTSQAWGQLGQGLIGTAGNVAGQYSTQQNALDLQKLKNAGGVK